MQNVHVFAEYSSGIKYLMFLALGKVGKKWK